MAKANKKEEAQHEAPAQKSKKQFKVISAFSDKVTKVYYQAGDMWESDNEERIIEVKKAGFID